MRTTRNQTLDTLRGLAILLMIIDHVAGVLFSVRIEPETIRFLTRLSMPLFAVLMGFFLASSTKTNWNRLLQIVVAAAVMNVVYFRIYQEFEILASLLACMILYLVMKRYFVGCFVAAYFFQIDPSRAWFDYSVCIVASCVAQGVILRIHGWRVATATGALVLLAVLLVSPPTQYALVFLLPATWLVAWGQRHPNWTLPGIETLGRYPLTAYLTQYFVILGLGSLR